MDGDSIAILITIFIFLFFIILISAILYDIFRMIKLEKEKIKLNIINQTLHIRDSKKVTQKINHKKK
jgi:ABC-type transport system involved in multi-copper enzyme maturation permease subunit